MRGSAQPPSSSLHTASHRYGWQTLTTGGAALALSSMTISATNGCEGGGDGVAVLAVATVGTCAVGAPIVHFSHGNAGRGFGSLALRGLFARDRGEIGARTSGCGYRR